MASKRSKKYPYQWPDGTWHSRPAKVKVQPSTPPAGSYDPVLDIEKARADRGLGDMLEDLQLAGRYSDADLAIAKQQLGQQLAQGRQSLDWAGEDNSRSYQRLLEDLGLNRRYTDEDYQTGISDLERAFGRQFEDLFTNRSRGTEDYGRAIENLTRQYGILGDRQVEQASVRGVLGGALAQAKRKRAENQALDRQPIDMGFNRFMEDSTKMEGRLGEDKTRARQGLDTNYTRAREGFDITERRGTEDYQTNTSRLGVQRSQLEQGYNSNLGQLMLNYQRGIEQRSTQGARAIRENELYGQDVNTLKVDQARQSGMLPAPTTKPLLYDWGDGKGEVHSRPKIDRARGQGPNGLWDWGDGKGFVHSRPKKTR